MSNVFEMKPEVGVSGKFFLQVYKADGTLKESAEFKNLILDAGLNRWGTGAIATHCKVGSGSTAPAVGQTALVTQIASTANTTGAPAQTYTASASGNGSVTVGRSWRFVAGTATGTIAEVGVGWDVGLFSRALILDGGGVPTTITVLSDEFLDVTYQLTINYPADVTGSMTLGGTSYNYTLRGCDLDGLGTVADVTGSLFGQRIAGWSQTYSSSVVGYTGDISTVLNLPSGTAIASTANGCNQIATAYANNSNQAITAYRAGLNDAVGNIKSARIQHRDSNNVNQFCWQIGFDVAVPKSNLQLLTFTITMNWARA